MIGKARNMTTRQLPHYWTLDQVDRLLGAMPAGQPWLFTLLLWRTGLRQAEALNLQWRDLNFSAQVPTVTVREGKGGRSRVVPAHRQLVEAFMPIRKGKPGDHVFPFSARTATRWIAQGIADAGLESFATGTGVKKPGSHSLRHSCARHWLQSGIEVNAVSVWLGHSSPAVTLNTYLVLAPGTLGDIDQVP